jgi:hypothetical protein
MQLHATNHRKRDTPRVEAAQPNEGQRKAPPVADFADSLQRGLTLSPNLFCCNLDTPILTYPQEKFFSAAVDNLYLFTYKGYHTVAAGRVSTLQRARAKITSHFSSYIRAIFGRCGVAKSSY